MTYTPLKEGDAVVVVENTPYVQKGAKGTVESVLGDIARVNFDDGTTYYCLVRRLERAEPKQPSLPGVESDPHGTPQHTPGAKLDAGKIRAGLVLGGFARALREVSAVGTYGANKYTPNGWMHVPNGVERYTDAMHRHLLAEATGEARDPDTEILHAAHAAWNALARLDLMIRKSEEK